MAVVFLGLGSNLGDRRKNIQAAVELLTQAGIKVTRLSSIIETDPVGGPPQGLFLNAAAKAETALSPREVLNVIGRIESALGRVRTVKDGPRTIDIDILTYDNYQINEPDLVIPHPRMHDRDFVMRPLQELI